MDIAKYIDNTLLKPEATAEQIVALCRESASLGCASVCVNPCHVALCARELAGTGVKVCTVIGFPLGATSTAAKAFETEQAIRDGAEEIDMVLNVGALKGGDGLAVLADISAVRKASLGKVLKVIIETCLLTDEEKVLACKLAKEAGADFVKTSTGFAGGGATASDIALMRKTVGAEMGVKASGGVRTRADALAMLEAGATRIGASSGRKIIEG